MRASNLNRFARAAAGAAFLLLIAGGLVTSTGSSLAVPDWPLSYGKFFPPMTGGVLFEHGHRMIAGLVAVMIWALAVWTWRAESRPWVKIVAAAAALGVLAQALLGGLTVLLKLPPAVSIAHACLGQTVFCLVLVIVQATSPLRLAARSPSPSMPDGLWLSPILCVAAVYIQLVSGAVVRHTGRAIPIHLAGAALAATLILWVSYRFFSSGTFDRPLLIPAGLAAALVPCQMFLGLVTWAVRGRPASPKDVWRTVFPTAHVAVGAALLGTCVIWTMRAYLARPAALEA